MTLHDVNQGDTLEKLTFERLYEMSNGFKKTLIPYILSRHLLYYTELRYAQLMKRQDKAIEKRAKNLGK